MKSPKYSELLPLKSLINKQNIQHSQAYKQQQLSRTQNISKTNENYNLNKTNKSYQLPTQKYNQIQSSQPHGHTYSLTKSNSNRFLGIQTFSYSQNLKIIQTVEHINGKIKILEKNQENQYNSMNELLKKSQSNIEKVMKTGCEKIQKLLHQVKQFCDNINQEHNLVCFYRSTNKCGETLAKHCLQNQAFQQILTNKITPLITDIKFNSLEAPYTKNIKLLSSLQTKFQQQFTSDLSRQQKQSHQQYIRLINYSNNCLQNLQKQIFQLNNRGQQKLSVLQDKIQILNYDLQQSIKNTKQIFANEHQMIQQLIEKIIYKMTYI